MAEKNSVLVRGSRYVSGGTTEVNTNALEWWERTILSSNSDDTRYVVEQKFEGRLDWIAAMFYNNESRYWWVIAQQNNILDPYSEVVTGTILYIPTLERVQAMLSGRTGGIDSKREVKTSILPIV